MKEQGSMANLTYVTWLKGIVLSSEDSRNIIEDQGYSAGDIFLVLRADKGEVINGHQEGYGHYQGRS